MALKFETTWNNLKDRVVADDVNRVDHNLQFGDLAVEPETLAVTATIDGGNRLLRLTDRAYQQYLGKLGIPYGFATKFSPGLQRDMIAERRAEMEIEAAEVFMRIRSDDQTVRAILSGRYGDIRDRQVAEILDEMVGEGKLSEFEVLRGRVKDHGFTVTLVGREAFGRFGGDQYYPTIQLGNSEVGAGSFVVVRGVCKGACSNGMLFGHKREGEVRIRHLGSKMNESVQFAMAQVLGGMDQLAERTLPAIAKAVEIEINAEDDKVVNRVVTDLRNRGLTKRFSLESLALAQNMPEDVYGDEFPVGPRTNRWALVNAMTHLAQETVYDQFQRYEIEAAAGALLLASLN